MFAVVEIGGKQFKVNQGDILEVDRLPQEAGESITFDTVLLYGESETSAKIGTPYVEGAQVEVKILEHAKADKIRVVKFTPKKRSSKTYGHRQPLSKLEVTSIKA